MALDVCFEWKNPPIVTIPPASPSKYIKAHADAIAARIRVLEDAMRDRLRNVTAVGSTLVSLRWLGDRWTVSATCGEAPDVVPSVELACLAALEAAGEQV